MVLIQNKSHYNVIIPPSNAGGRQHSIPPSGTAEVPAEDWDAYSQRKNPLLIKAGYVQETNVPARSTNVSELDSMHHRTAVKHVSTIEDIGHLEQMLARETRKSVRRALTDRMRELMK